MSMSPSPHLHLPGDRNALVDRRLQIVARLQTLRTQAEEVQGLLTALREQRAVVQEERQCVSAEYRLLTDDAAPLAWTQPVLEQERLLLREAAALGRERLRLITELRRLREERFALLEEQAAVLARLNGSVLHPWGVLPPAEPREP